MKQLKVTQRSIYTYPMKTRSNKPTESRPPAQQLSVSRGQTLEPRQIQTKLQYDGHRVLELEYPRMEKPNLYSKTDIHRLVTDLQHKYRKSNWMLEVSVNVPDIGWRSAPAFHISEHASIVPENYDFTASHQFCVYVWEAATPAGGNDDDHNDCLYRALMKATSNQINFAWRSGAKFKAQLGLSRDAKVPVSRLPDIETALSLNLHCTGEYERTSPCLYPRTVTLHLAKEHYTLVHTRPCALKMIKSFLAKDPKPLLVYQAAPQQPGHVTVFHPELGFQTVTMDTLRMEVVYEPYVRLQVEASEDVQEAYASRVRWTEEVRKVTTEMGFIVDMDRMKYNPKHASMWVFYHFTQDQVDPESLTEMEAIWIRHAMKGGLVYGEPASLANATCFDINSAYPSMLLKPSSSYPMRPGTFHSIDQLPFQLNAKGRRWLPYGIYRVHVTPSADPHTNKLFRFNEKDKYTHTDLESADLLGLKMELLCDEQANFLEYRQGRVNGDVMFRKTIRYLFDLKRRMKQLHPDNPWPKEMLSSLWGSLCEKRKSVIISFPRQQKPTEINNAIILSTHRDPGGGHRVEYCSRDKPFFRYNYARLGPFLTAQVRYALAKTMFPHKDRMYRFHTDSMVTDLDVAALGLSVGTDLGQWKVEKQGNVVIDNCNRLTWN